MALRALLVTSLAALSSASSSKRGLVFVPSSDHPSDNTIWTQSGSDLTWYYNYGDTPSPAFASLTQSAFEFVPMMWGVNAQSPNDTAFRDAVENLIKGGRNITHVLGFNEPDGPAAYGGSDIAPNVAAQAWVANFEPLAEKYNVKLGMPAVTGGWGGLPWLKQFLGNCSKIVSEGQNKTKNCTWDFVPVHWYDNFEGLASHIGEVKATWPEAEVWVTEYAYAHQSLEATEQFFNESLAYLDRLSYLGRYSYFGSFRSDTSNVGPNAAFLNDKGKLTHIGVQYLGVDAKGVNPSSGPMGPVGSCKTAAVVASMVVAGMVIWGMA